MILPKESGRGIRASSGPAQFGAAAGGRMVARVTLPDSVPWELTAARGPPPGQAARPTDLRFGPARARAHPASGRKGRLRPEGPKRKRGRQLTSSGPSEPAASPGSGGGGAGSAALRARLGPGPRASSPAGAARPDRCASRGPAPDARSGVACVAGERAGRQAEPRSPPSPGPGARRPRRAHGRSPGEGSARAGRPSPGRAAEAEARARPRPLARGCGSGVLEEAEPSERCLGSCGSAGLRSEMGGPVACPPSHPQPCCPALGSIVF